MIPRCAFGLYTSLLILWLAHAAPAAETVRNIRSRVTEPIAIRDGVMMLPLEASEGTTNWPQSMPLVAADGTTLDGLVIWIHPVPASHIRNWTDDPRGLAVRFVQPNDDLDAVNPMIGEGPHLVVRLPMDGEGSLKLGKQTLKPRWMDAAAPKTAVRFQDEGDFAIEEINNGKPQREGDSDRRPDADSPFEHWRAALMAHQIGEEVPLAPMHDEAAALAAEHFAGLWMLGLARLQQADPATCTRLIHLLTRTCSDRGRDIAAWVTDPRAITALLDRLVDVERSPAELSRDAKLWMEMQPPVMIWPVSEFGPTVELRAMTLADEPVLASLRWEGLSDGSTVVRLEPAVVTHIQIDRPPLPTAGAAGMAPPPEPARQTLIASAGRMESRLEFGPRTLEARPPGVLFGTLNAPITLAEAQARFRRAMPVQWTTSAQLRRISGRWEVFVECLRPNGESGAGGSASDDPGAATEERQVTSDELRMTNDDSGSQRADERDSGDIKSLDDVRGKEAITLLMGDPAGDKKLQVWLTIPESGWQQLIQGQNDGTLQVHRRSLSDRWFCRIVLPDSWIPLPDAGPLQMALVRSHGDNAQLETSPGISTPWQPNPARVFIDLAHWDALTLTR